MGQGFGREASRSHRLREAVPATVDQEQASHREEREEAEHPHRTEHFNKQASGAEPWKLEELEEGEIYSCLGEPGKVSWEE